MFVSKIRVVESTNLHYRINWRTFSENHETSTKTNRAKKFRVSLQFPKHASNRLHTGKLVRLCAAWNSSRAVVISVITMTSRTSREKDKHWISRSLCLDTHFQGILGNWHAPNFMKLCIIIYWSNLLNFAEFCCCSSKNLKEDTYCSKPSTFYLWTYTIPT